MIANVSSARLVNDHRLYIGRTIGDRDGEWVRSAFHNVDSDGGLVGAISDPMSLPGP